MNIIFLVSWFTSLCIDIRSGLIRTLSSPIATPRLCWIESGDHPRERDTKIDIAVTVIERQGAIHEYFEEGDIDRIEVPAATT